MKTHINGPCYFGKGYVAFDPLQTSNLWKPCIHREFWFPFISVHIDSTSYKLSEFIHTHIDIDRVELKFEICLSIGMKWKWECYAQWHNILLIAGWHFVCLGTPAEGESLNS